MHVSEITCKNEKRKKVISIIIGCFSNTGVSRGGSDEFAFLISVFGLFRLDFDSLSSVLLWLVKHSLVVIR